MSNQKTMLSQQRPQTVREQQLRQQQQREQGVQNREKVPHPPAELSENYEWMRLTVDLPGVQLKDLDVNINHGVLTIEGVRRTMTVDGSVCVKKQKVSRRYAIDTDVVDMQKVEANLKVGVLTIKAPKKSKPNRVRVDVTEDDEGVSFDRNVTVSTQPNMSVTTQPNVNVTTQPIQPNVNVTTQPIQPNVNVSMQPIQPNVNVSMQPIMSVAPVTTTPDLAAPIQAGPTPSLTRDEEARAICPNPPSFTLTSTSPQGATSIKEEHGIVQPDDLINHSGTDRKEMLHASGKT